MCNFFSYRLSPQFPYPDPHDDCAETVNYLRESAVKLKIDPNRIAIGGDSAGGKEVFYSYVCVLYFLFVCFRFLVNANW